MTISSSLNAGVAGLNANATRLATIADNIANSGTYGYKRASAEFESLVITGQRGAGIYSAGGVRASSARLIDERGALVGTANALDIAISGRGMLPVAQSVDIGVQGDQPMMMTRTGAFAPMQKAFCAPIQGWFCWVGPQMPMAQFPRMHAIRLGLCDLLS